MVLLLSLPDLDASSLSPESPLHSPTSLETPSPTSLSFSPSSHLPAPSPEEPKSGSRNDIFSQTFTPVPSPLSPSSSSAGGGVVPDKPRLGGVAGVRRDPALGRERSSTGPALLPSALALHDPPKRRMDTLDAARLPLRSDSLRAPPAHPSTPSHHATSFSSVPSSPHHEKTPSGASARSVSSSTKTSSFFDSPRAVTTPPPPPRQPMLSVRPNLPPRTASYESSMPKSSKSARSTSPAGSIPSPTPTPSSPPIELLELTASLSDMNPPPPVAALRLSTAPSYLLGTGLTSSVYLASSKGKEAGWNLCAAKILSDESGIEGQQALAREEKVLRWLGAGRSKTRQGIVSYVGAVGVVQVPLPTENLTTGQVRARRRTSSISTNGPFETFSTANKTLINDVLGSKTAADPATTLLLEYCPFGTVGDFVQTHPELVDEALFVKWMGDLARGGEWLQARGVIHRDIKPQNILLSASLEPRLTDFGSSLVIAPNSPLMSSLDVTSGAGTLPYSSPELLQAPTKVSYPSDLFSLGCTLYVILNGGKDPYRGVSGTREMVFWVAGAKFWEFEERARAASIGEGIGAMGFKRGRSLREPGKGADKAVAALEVQEEIGSGMRKLGSLESLRVDKPSSESALAASSRDWWKSRRSTADDGVLAGQRATRRSLEIGLTVSDDGRSTVVNGKDGPPQDHLLRLLSTSPNFAPLTLLSPISSSHPPPPSLRAEDEDDEGEALPGSAMFYPASTPYHPLQVPESLRKLLKQMLSADPSERGSMRDVRLWAASHGWKAQTPEPKDE